MENETDLLIETAQMSGTRDEQAPTDQCVTLGGEDDKVARWSTLRGSRGSVTIWKRHLATLDRILVYTDGVDDIVKPLYKLDEEAWQAQVQRLQKQSGNDDMTILEIICQESD
jgi:hypothetical protein